MALEREWRDMAYLPRWSIVRRVRDQYLTEHSYYVTLYAMQLADELGWTGNHADLARYALVHDAAEIDTGDIPSNTKRAMTGGDVDALEIDVFRAKFPDYIERATYRDPDVPKIVKVADGFDAVFWILGEMQMGNRTLGELDTTLFSPSTIWEHEELGKNNRPVIYRNLHRLKKSWLALAGLPISDGDKSVVLKCTLDSLWISLVIPALRNAATGKSVRVF